MRKHLQEAALKNEVQMYTNELCNFTKHANTTFCFIHFVDDIVCVFLAVETELKVCNQDPNLPFNVIFKQ